MEEYSVGDRESSKPNIEFFKQVFNPIDVKADDDLLPYFFNESTSGEFWVISYARQHPEFTCVIDESFARSICDVLSIKVTGTIGIIKEMKNKGLLTSDDLKSIKSSIKKSRFYLSAKLLRELDEICGSIF